MNKIYDLKQDRAKLVAQMREIMDRNADVEMNVDDKATYAKLEKDFDALNERIAAEEKLMDRERSIDTPEDKKDGKDKTSERQQLFARALSGSAADIAAYRNDFTGDYTLDTGATAGYLSAPMQFVEQLIKGLDDVLYMRRISHKTPSIGAAQTLGFPYRATAAADADWKTEVEAASVESTLTYGQREFKPNRLTKLIKLSKTLVGHSNMAPSVVLDELRRVIGVTLEKAYMTGNGSGKPLGIFTASNDGVPTTQDVTAANATSFVFEDFIDLKYKLKGQYHNRAQWIMHRDLVKAVAKIKDLDGQYIWQPSAQAGQPDRLLGSPVNMSEFAPNTYTAGLYAAVYGDFDFYWICDADALYLQVLNELYATTNQVGYLFQYFGDGAPVVGEAFARLKMGAGATT